MDYPHEWLVEIDLENASRDELIYAATEVLGFSEDDVIECDTDYLRWLLGSESLP